MERKPADMQTLAGSNKDKQPDTRHFPVSSLEDVMRELRRVGGTGKMELHFKNGYIRGNGKFEGYVRVK
jgi:hypothetical protein